MSYHDNAVRLKAVARILSNHNKDVIYVGGATIGLYATRPLSVNVRGTNDVDVAVELLSYGDYVKLNDFLLSEGFANNPEKGIISSYKMEGLLVDIMPINPINGVSFGNRWYAEGYGSAILYTLPEPDLITIKILSPPYLIASKIMAYKSRGDDDILASHDMEDIIFVLDNKDDIEKELLEAPESVKDYLGAEFNLLLQNPRFEDSILGNVQPINQTERKNRILQILNSVFNNPTKL